ncbi:MAG: hypothetical protein IJ784_06065 [Ruminiclostridium sp.]|nr:hypothetical protein [Ruminiclostridium sp.]
MNEENLQYKYCTNCNRKVPYDAVFCCYCGAKGQFSDAPARQKRSHGSGTVMFDQRSRKGFIARDPSPNRTYLGTYPTVEAAEQAIDNFKEIGCPNL